MATANRKTAVARPQPEIRRFKVEHLGPQCSWPKGEAIPASMEEAIAGGWRVDNDDVTEANGERSIAGVQTLRKTVGDRSLTLKIRYRAEYTHSQPFKPQARTFRVEEFVGTWAVRA